MKLTFTILQSPGPAERGQKRTVDLPDHDSLTIGREYDARLQLGGGGYISRHHLVLEVSGSLCLIRDLGSRNGTFVRRRDTPDVPQSWVQSQPGQATPLYNGDYLRFGQRQGSRTVLQVHFRVPAPETRTEELIYCARCGQSAPEPATGGLGPYVCSECRQQEAAQPDIARLPTDVTPDYELLEEVGRGGMGVVYRARRVTPGHPQVPPGTVVALKTIIPEMPLAEQDRKRFKRETDICEALYHPHIVRLFDRCDFQQERLWFVMEFVQGQNAAQRAPFPLDEALTIADQILNALTYAHQAPVPSIIDGQLVYQHGVVHRDIKPSNILVTGSGASLHAKLADLGLAKGFQLAGQSHFTKTDERRGTPIYMSPDQIQDFRSAGPAADVYSFGATLYTLLTGQYPYELTGEDLFLTILEKPIIPLQHWQPYPAQHDPGRWDAVAQIIERAMSKHSDERYASAAEMRMALAGVWVDGRR